MIFKDLKYYSKLDIFVSKIVTIKEPYWKSIEEDFLKNLISYILRNDEFSDDERNFDSLLKILKDMEKTDNISEIPLIKKVFAEHQSEFYKVSEDVKKSVVIAAANDLEKFIK